MISKTSLGIVYRRMSKSVKIKNVRRVISALIDRDYPIICTFDDCSTENQIEVFSDQLTDEFIETLNLSRLIKLNIVVNEHFDNIGRTTVIIENTLEETGIYIELSELYRARVGNLRLENAVTNFVEEQYRFAHFDYAYYDTHYQSIKPVDIIFNTTNPIYELLYLPGNSGLIHKRKEDFEIPSQVI